MYSVTSDPATSPSFPVTPPRSAKTDLPQANDSFAALVDSNAASDARNDRAQDQSAAQRRSDETSSAADVRRSRDDAARVTPG